MAFTDINSEDRLVQTTFAEHLEQALGWENVYAWNNETFGPGGTLGRMDSREVVLTRDLRAALARLNSQLPPEAVEAAVGLLTWHDATRLDAEQRRAAEEGLSEDELALFDLLAKDNVSKADRERVKQASRSLLASIQQLIAPLERWTDKEQTQAEVETFILDHVFLNLPTPPFTEEEKQEVAKRVYQHIWQQSVAPQPIAA